MLNETSFEAVVREALEGTGYEFEIERLVFVQERFIDYTGKGYHEIIFFYLMKPINDLCIKEGAFTDQPKKETLHWLSIDELPNTNLVPEFLKNNLQNIGNHIQHIITKQ